MRIQKKERDFAELSDNYERVMLIELKAAAKEGAPLFARYGGTGMEPLLRKGRDMVNVKPVTAQYKPQPYDVLAIEMNDRCVFRRFIRCDGDGYIVCSDVSRQEERVTAASLVGVLDVIKHCDGSTLMCSGSDWIKQSKRSVRNHKVKCLFDRERMRYWAIAYFVVLFMSMWLPVDNLPIPDNMILGLRPDHVFHGSIFLLCPYFMQALFVRRSRTSRRVSICACGVLIGSVAVAMLTEFGQKALPYRSFDINDLIANLLGVTIGWVILFAVSNRKGRVRMSASI